MKYSAARLAFVCSFTNAVPFSPWFFGENPEYDGKTQALWNTFYVD